MCTGQVHQVFGFTESNGLSSYNVRDITQDKYGFIWISTQDGLNRFDGGSFSIFNRASRPALSGNDCTNAYYDRALNNLWIGTSNGGLDVLNILAQEVTFQLSADSIKKYIKDPAVKRIKKLSNGDVFVGLGSGFAVIGGSDIKKNPPVRYFNLNRQVVDLYENSGDITVLFYDGFIYRYNNKYELQHELSIDKTIKNCYVYNTSIDEKNNRVYICTESGTYRHDIKNMQSEIIRLAPEAGTPFYVKRLNDRDLLLATNMGVFLVDNDYKIKKRREFIISAEFKDWERSINLIYVSDKGDIFYGSRKGLFIEVPNESAFQNFYTDPITKSTLSHLYYLKPIDSVNILACNINGLFSVDMLRKTIAETNPNKFYYYFFEDHRRQKFIAREDGLFVADSYTSATLIKASEKFHELKDVDGYKFGCHLLLNDSIIVLGTDEDKSVIIWNTKSHRVQSLIDLIKSLESRFVNGIIKIDDESFLLVTDNEIIVYNIRTKQDKKIVLKDNKGRIIRMFLDVLKVDSTYWIASYGTGILIVDQKGNLVNEINSNSGLSNNSIYKMLEDDFGNVWVSTNFGLNRINKKSLKISQYFKKDGLHGDAFEEYSANKYGKRLFFGGPNGFSVVNPELLSTPKIPQKCVFLSYKTDDGKLITEDNLLEKGEIEIPNTKFLVNLSFVSINYDLSRLIRYKYRIRELNNSWIYLDSKNEIPLLGLKPGKYSLEIKAMNENGEESEPSFLTLIFLPKWYQTWWFYLLIIITVVAILYALYRYRISQVQKQHEIRKNIATDLHDDLGSTLNSVKVFTNLAISGVKQEESLQQIKDNLTEATMSLRDMIWVLDDSLDTVDELVTRLKQFALPVAAASNMEADINADNGVNGIKLTKEEKRNLFLVCKEAINNSIKYSNGTQINVFINPAGKRVQIAVSDNGKGFNTDEVKKGYGLKNMQYRAEQIRYKILLTSSLGKGTQVEIRPAG